MSMMSRYNDFMNSIHDFDEDVQGYLFFMYYKYYEDYPEEDIESFWADMFHDTMGPGVFSYLQNKEDYEDVFRIVPDIIDFVEPDMVMEHMREYPEDSFRRYCLQEFNTEVLNLLANQ